MQRCFRADRPNELWVVDFTYVPTWSGMAFTAFVTDVFSRRIVGLADHEPDADRAAAGRARDGAVGPRPSRATTSPGSFTTPTPESQYTAIPLRRAARRRRRDRLDRHRRRLATTTPWPRSVVGLYKTECVKIDGPFRTVDELELATLSWVHWFNENRLHSSIGYLTPDRERERVLP